MQKNSEDKSTLSSPMSRRDALRLLAAASLTSSLLACSGENKPPEETTPDGGGLAETTPDTVGNEQPAETITGSWASGGTKAMTEKSSYPDPFTAALTTCALIERTTEGPCTTSKELEREDISEGLEGLPVRLGIKVTNTSCQPLVGAIVKVWHTNTEGSYSGETPNNRMCLKNQAHSSKDFFRGYQKTDANGVVFFDTCFPGWYRGRAIHIHFQIKEGNKSTKISQLFFPEETTKEIFSSHNDYKRFGQPDTVFANDNVIGRIAKNEWERHIMTVTKMKDGAMLAAKVVAVS